LSNTNAPPKPRGNRPGNKGKGNPNRRRRRRPPSSEYPDDEEGSLEVIAPEELEASKNIMNLTELKTRPAAALVELGESLGVENLARSRKQDIIFLILKTSAAQVLDDVIFRIGSADPKLLPQLMTKKGIRQIFIVRETSE
jgi:hypothetical protein